MQLNRVQLGLASIALLTTAVLANVLAPRDTPARSRATDDLTLIVPRTFGGWSYVPGIGLVTPAAAAGTSAIYSQVLARGYRDGDGNIVMLLVAYGPSQDAQLKAHRPELCYVASGFRVSNKTDAEVNYREGAKPIPLTRLTAENEARLERISYWMRVGNEISHGVVDRQMIRLKYGLRGIIPDGALIRVSTIGLTPEASFKLQDQFIRDLLAALQPKDLAFFTGGT